VSEIARSLLLVGLLVLPGAAAATGVGARIDAVEQLLMQEQIDEAVSQTEELYRAFPDVAPVQLLAGRLKFYQGDYQGAVRLLERSLDAYGDEPARESPFLAISRGARDVTADYRSAESAHFICRTPAGKDELLAPYALDALERARERLGKVFGHFPRRKIVVDVLPSAEALAKISPLTVEAIETSGTIALAKYGRLMITSPKALWRGYPWLDTLAHEYIHLLVTERSRNQVPVWLQEGLAKFFESSWRGAPGTALEPGGERLLASAVKEGELITFEQMHPSMALLPTREATALAFAEVFTAVEFIRDRHGADAIGAIIGHIREGESADAAIAHALGMSFGQFISSWRRYLRERPYQVVPGAQPRRLVFKKRGDRDDLEQTKLDTELDRTTKNWTRLGDLLRQAGRPKAAAVEYQRAVDRAGVRAPQLMNRLAATYIEVGDFKRAEVTLQAALKPMPTDPQTHILLGRVALAQQRWDVARKAYLVANREHPFHPEIHASLLAVARAQGDRELAAQEERALRLLSAHAAAEAAGKSAVLREGDAAAGFLTVETRPFARLLVNDDDLGLWTPVVELPLRTGKHRLRLRNGALGIDERVEVEIKAGESVKIERELKVEKR